MDTQTEPRPRINGSMLSKFKGKAVCLLGKVADPDASGMSFKMTTSDNMTVLIQLHEPIQEYLHGVIQIHGVVKNDKLISCTNYVTFPEEYTQNFDMGNYNSAVELINSKPEFYIHYEE